MCPERRFPASRVQSGFALVTGIFLVVVLAALGAFILFVSGLMTSASTLDVQGSRAYQAARAGIEWGSYQILQVPAFALACDAASPASTTPTNLALGTFTATVTCTASAPLTEGDSTSVRAYRIVSTGCNAAACPGAVTATYVERQLSLSITN